ncbi:MAG TPA: hypothetical protein VMF70_01695 [Gemmatimonadales bacterium]|nr:hypothetical protein [Gemmatimonadales bacterium]
MSWQRQSKPPAELLARHPPTVIRAVDHTGGWILFYKPFISGDSLGGYRDSTLAGSRYAMPLADVASVEVRQVDAGRSVLALAAVGASAALVYGAIKALDNMTLFKAPDLSGFNMRSCPLVYSWDGRHWRLDSGTFGGAIVEALQRTDLDNLDFARAVDGTLRLRVTNELAETDHVDALAVVAVDHDAGLAVAPDPAGGIHTIGALQPPLTATDFRGADALARVRDADGWNWESAVTGRDPARATDLRDGLVLAFARPRGATRAHLVVDANSSAWGTHLLVEFIRAHGSATQAWYDSMNARPAAARAVQARLAREAFLAASVRTASGWQPAGLFWEAGPEIVKRQVLDLDLSAVAGDTVLVRLESAPSFWDIDRVAMDYTPDQAVTVHELTLLAARDQAGRDIAPLIAAVDHRDYALAHGASAEVVLAVPPLPSGQTRSFLLRSTGWYRVDTPEAGAPDLAALTAFGRDSLAVGRASVLRLNAALAALAEGTR